MVWRKKGQCINFWAGLQLRMSSCGLLMSFNVQPGMSRA